MTGAGGWRLIRCDEQSIVAALRNDPGDGKGPQCLLRFVSFSPVLATWDFAIDATAAPALLADIAEAWEGAKTMIGPPPAPRTSEGSS